MREVVIVDSVRTGLAKSFRGKFNLTRPDDMAAHCVNALLALRSPDFAILSGDDGTAARSILSGVDGLISVGSNALPGAYRRMCDLAAAGEREATESWDARLEPFHEFCGVESNPIPVKWAVHQLGLIPPGIRLPLTPLSESCQPAVRTAMQQAGVI